MVTETRDEARDHPHLGNPAPNRRRWRPGSGVVAGVLLYVGASGFGDTPDTRDTTAQVASYFTDHRASILIGVVMVGAAMVATLAHTAEVSRRLDELGEGRRARLVLTASTLAVAVLVVGLLLPYAALSYVIGAESPEAAKAFFEITLVTSPIVALPLALLVAAAGVGPGDGMGGSRKRWFIMLSALMAVVLAGAGCGFAARGPMSPDVEQQVVFALFTIWLLVSGAGTRAAESTGPRAPRPTGPRAPKPNSLQ